MKAIILNSGIGKRLHPFTNLNPKCLIKLNGKTILGHEIENLLYYRIKDIIITVGPFSEKIKGFVKNNFPQVNATYVNNPKYESTNSIYSMWLVKDFVDDDVIFMHGDMVFNRELVGKLLKSERKNLVLVDNKIKDTKDFKCKIKNSVIKEIGAKVSGEDTFFLAPIYKLSKNDFKIWLHEIGKNIEKGSDALYGEDVIKNIYEKIKLYPIYIDDEFCMEIDDFNDLKIARKFFLKRAKK